MRRLIKTPAVIARAPFGFAQGKLRARSNLILLLILLSIAVTAPISAEEIKLTTIVPDQTVLRAKKGVIGNTYYTDISDGSIPTSALLVQGNVGIGTSTPSPATKLEVNGIMRLAPTARPAGTAGMIYYDSNNTMYYYKGGASPEWVDLGGGGGGAFGDWIDRNFSWGQDMTADTDGIVVGYAYKCTALSGYTKLFPGNPIVLVAASIGVSEVRSITFPVRKNDPWKVTVETTDEFALKALWWVPMGN